MNQVSQNSTAETDSEATTERNCDHNSKRSTNTKKNIAKEKEISKNHHQNTELNLQNIANNLANVVISFENEINGADKNGPKIIKLEKREFFKNSKTSKKSEKISIVKQPSKNNAQITKPSSSFGTDPLQEIKENVLKAVKNHKVFTVRGGFSSIRNALLSRDWIEKYHISYKDTNEEIRRHFHSSISELVPLVRSKEFGDLVTKLIKSKLLINHQPDFYWATNMEVFKENPDKIKLTIVNKLKKNIFSFATKQGLVEASKYSHWYHKPNIAKFNHPRSYCLSQKENFKEFLYDFYTTAAMSLLKRILKVSTTQETRLISPSGKIPLEAFQFAINECCKLIKIKKHEDIDKEIPEATEEEWTQFLEYFYKIVHFSNHFKENGTETEESLIQKTKYILNNLEPFYDNLYNDGFMNLWILKPAGGSQGKGISVCRNLKTIVDIIQGKENVKFILQKYIERPLLIHSTKFDIRQWFLISSCNPLTIWMYKECYLRFSSQTYNLRKLHESIHLTNNSVQKKYEISLMDAELPRCNMWDSSQFENYLSNIGYPRYFKEIVYPGMKECITAAVLINQDKIIMRKNCFELYGADFILSEDYQPWLLEINSSPALFASTSVTAKMCPRVLEDVIKVVVDYPRNPKSPTGAFEMIYKEKTSNLTDDVTMKLDGVSVQKSFFYTSELIEEKNSFYLPKYYPLLFDKKQLISKKFADEVKKILKNLLEIIQKEKQKKKQIVNEKTAE